MQADASLDALTTGKNSVHAEEARYRADPGHFDLRRVEDTYKTAPSFAWDGHACRNTQQNCATENLIQRANRTKQINANALLLQRYAQMQALQGYEEHIIPGGTAAMPIYSYLTTASEMTITKAEFEIADGHLQNGIAMLQKNDRYLHLLAEKSTSLISKMVTLSMLRKQARTISELVNKYPKLASDYGDSVSALVRPLTQSELDFSSALMAEARFINFFLNIDYAQTNVIEDPADSPIALNVCEYLCKLFLQPNATVNDMAAYWQARIATANQPASHYTQIRQTLIAQKSNQQAAFKYLRYAYNPVGKILTDVAAQNPDTYLSYMEKSADIDAYLRLVGLQIKLRQNKIADNAIADYVAHAEEPFRSPYDDSAMIWNAKEKQLEFVGRQSASWIFNPGKRFVIKMS